MKSRDAIRMGSFRALVALLEETETSALPGIARARVAFITEIKKAEALEKLQADDLKPALQLRDAAFQKLETVVLRVAGLAASYAAETGDPQLILACRLDLRELTNGAYRQRAAAAEQFHDRIAELLPVLGEAEITAADIAELAEAIADAHAQLAAPRQQLSRRIDATAELNLQIRRLGGVRPDTSGCALSAVAPDETESVSALSRGAKAALPRRLADRRARGRSTEEIHVDGHGGRGCAGNRDDGRQPKPAQRGAASGRVSHIA